MSLKRGLFTEELKYRNRQFFYILQEGTGKIRDNAMPPSRACLTLMLTLLQPSPKPLVPLEMIPQDRLKHQRFIGAFCFFLCGLHIEIKLIRNLLPEPEPPGNRFALHLNIEIVSLISAALIWIP